MAFSDLNLEPKPVRILRDTGAALSFILADVLPFSSQSSCNSDVLVQGIELGVVRVPLHVIYLRSDIVTGLVKVAVRTQLPLKGLSLILGNDLAGSKVSCLPEVTEVPFVSENDGFSQKFPGLFRSCVVTRAQARKFENEIDLSNSFMSSDSPDVEDTTVEACSLNLSLEPRIDFPFDRQQLIDAQHADDTLRSCLSAVIDKSKLDDPTVAYFIDDGVLMRKWSPENLKHDWSSVFQVVVPQSYRESILSVAHDHELSGHLGIKKTYNNLLKHFFWPGMKSTVSQYCRSCHACQVAGKPNQVISPAPLKPIPVMNEPFEKLVIDCVGPLPRTKSGHSYLLTLMCSATRFPEAIPLRTLKTPAIVKALVKFCTTFGLPKHIQSDQGSNFMSRVFRKVTKELNIKHCVSSAYHPQSQGVLERFHQTLKSMVRTYCLQHKKDWDEEIPLLLFAVRNTVQESLGFSPAELVFGHSLRGPLKVLQEQLLSVSQSDTPPKNVLDHVSSFRERLHSVWQLAQHSLANSQTRMKGRYDKKSVQRSFKVGDQVLVLLPLPGSVLQAKFTGPYVIEEKLSDTDYVVRTPERRRKTRICHINMLKLYVSPPDSKDSASSSVLAPAAVTSVNVVASEYSPCEDNLHLGNACLSGARLQNSKALVTLHSKLSHLSSSSQSELVQLIDKYSSLFSDVPTVTNVLVHDIDVGDHPPVKQNAYRVNPVKREIMEKETQYLVENGLAVPSCSPWCSPCLLVPKPDGTSRFCTDYRKVNKLTKSDSYPLPRMEDCIDRIGNAKFVTKLDLLKGYWQVPLTERASEISAFATPDAFLQYKVLAFGLKNAPATFQRLMNQVLAKVKNCEDYLDDVVCYSDTWSSHLLTLEEVFSRFQAVNLTLNLAKCEFCHATVKYLGKEVGHGTVRPLEAKVQAIVEFPVPKSKRDLRRLLGMAGYYRSFCKLF